jgi:hypothetical protein
MARDIILLKIEHPNHNLPTMIEKIGKDLDKAKEPAEFLETINKLSLVNDMNKAAIKTAKKEQTRNPRFKEAYDDIIKICYQCEQDVIFMRRRAEILLAQEYDNGVATGIYSPPHRTSEKEKKEGAQSAHLSDHPKLPTQNEMGIKHQDMSKYRKSAVVEREFPGVVEQTIRAATEKGEEPTITKVRTVEKNLYDQVRDKVRSSEKEAQKQRQEKVAAHDDFIQNSELPPIWKDRFKSDAGPDLSQFVRDFCSRLEKEKMKLEEIMHHADKISTFERRVTLPRTLGDVGEFFLECARLLKNQEILPDIERLTVINPDDNIH